jgi:septal ring factor EnvC (AmiA/AmiB activator)
MLKSSSKMKRIPYTVRYEAVNAMLLNEFLKEHRKVEKHEDTIAQLQKEIVALTASLGSQTAEIKKISEQLAAMQPLPRLVNSH